MKKTYKAPKLKVHGSIEELTLQTKTIGKDDGIILIVDGLTPPDGVSIGSF